MTSIESRDKWYASLSGCWRDVGPDEIWEAAYRAGQLAMRELAEVLCVRIGGAKGSCDAVLCADKIRQLEPE